MHKVTACAAALAVVVIALQRPVAAQEGLPTADQLSAEIAELEAVMDPSAPNAAPVVAERLRQLKLAAAARDRIARSRDELGVAQAALEQAPAELERMRLDLAASAPAPAAPSGGATLEVLEQRNATAKAALGSARARAEELRAELAALRLRPEQATVERSEVTTIIERQRSALASPLAAGTSQALESDTRAAQAMQLAAAGLRAELLDVELAGLGQRTQLQTLRLELAERDVSQAQARVASVEAAIADRQRQRATRSQMDAERDRAQAAAKGPVIRAAAERNAVLSKRAVDLARQLERLRAGRQAVRDRATRISSDAQQAAKRIEIAGMSDTLGRVLRKEFDRLPTRDELELDEARRRDRLTSLADEEVELVEHRDELLDRGAHINDLLDEQDLRSDVEQLASVRADLDTLLAAREPLLDGVIDLIDDMVRTVAEQSVAQAELARAANDYRLFLNERLLWLPDAEPVSLRTVDALVPAFGWLADPAHWRDAAVTLARAALRDYGFSLFAIVVPVLLIAQRRRFASRQVALGLLTRRIKTDSFAVTLKALGLLLLGAAAWPLLLGLIGHKLTQLPEASVFARALGNGLVDAAYLGLFVLGAMSLCRSGGIGVVHFRWPEAAMMQLRTVLHRAFYVLVPALLVTSMMSAQPNLAYQHSLGRLAFVVLVLGLAVVLYITLHPTRGIPAGLLAQNPGGWWSRLCNIWYPLALLLPVALAIVALAGFMYTALRMSELMVSSAVVLGCALVANYLVLRWLYVERRRLELAQRVAERAARRERREAEATSERTLPPDEPPGFEEPEVDIEAVGEQTRHLLKVSITVFVLGGLYLLWSDVLPALDLLERVELWHYSSPGADGADTVVAFTLKSLVLLLALGILVWAAARNLPGVLEIAVLQRLPLDSGSRYAITSIAQYLIVAFGLSTILSTLGVAWSNVQWLVAALGVGLGFGMQEIFGNFISGLILLFERPVRIGDTVTVGDVSGTVSRIRIRATTLADWDGKEIVVPNKTFITERLTNWTLSNTVTRVVLRVGVSYDSDIREVEKLLYRIADAHEEVLDDPVPQVLFVGLGASSLDFEVRVFTDELADRLLVMHDLHGAVLERFRHNGISIPFPQQDVNLNWQPPPAAGA